jgi:hypothetical protein
MRSFFVAVVLVLVPFGSVAQDSVLKPDGRMWQTWTDSGSQNLFIKAAYVQGALEGLRVGAEGGYFAGRGDEARADLSLIKQCIDKGPCASIPPTMLLSPPSSAEYEAGADKAREHFVTHVGTSILDIVRQMDKFYGDYRNTPVCMIEALQESIHSLNGTALSEQDLETMRKQPCTP